MPPIISFLDFTSGGPTPPPTPLQTITWTMSSSQNASILSTGQDIIDVSRTNSLGIYGAQRLFNGTVANDAGATNKSFPSSGACETWWENYQVRSSQNSRDWCDQSKNDTQIYTSCQPGYNNQQPAQWKHGGWWIDQYGPGLEITMEVYPSGGLPSMWYSNEVGAGSIDTFNSNDSTVDYSDFFPESNQPVKIRSKGGAPWAAASGHDQWVESQYLGTNAAAQAASDNHADYVAIYASSYAIDGLFGSPQTEGWYVFGNKTFANGRSQWEPIAWPTGGANGDGLKGAAVCNVKTPIAFLDDYTDALGNGGTDNWHKPIGSLMLGYEEATPTAIYACNREPLAGMTGGRVRVSFTNDTAPGIYYPYRSSTGATFVAVTDLINSGSGITGTAFSGSAVNTNQSNLVYTHAAMWTKDYGWKVGPYDAGGGFKSDARITLGNTYNEMGDVPKALMVFDYDPGDVSSWSEYEGDLGDYDVQSSGVYKTQYKDSTVSPVEVLTSSDDYVNPTDFEEVTPSVFNLHGVPYNDGPPGMLYLWYPNRSQWAVATPDSNQTNPTVWTRYYKRAGVQLPGTADEPVYLIWGPTATNIDFFRNYDGPTVSYLENADSETVFYPDSTDPANAVFTEAASTYMQIGRMDSSGGDFRLRNATGNYSTNAADFPPYIAVYHDGDWGVFEWNNTTDSGNRYTNVDGTNFSTSSARDNPSTLAALSSYTTGDYLTWNEPVKLELEGTSDATITNGITSSTFTGFPGKITSIQVRSDFGLGLVFANQTDRDAWVAEYPETDSAISFEYNGIHYRTKSSSTGEDYTYDTATVNSRVYIPPSDFFTFPDMSSPATGVPFTIRGF